MSHIEIISDVPDTEVAQILKQAKAEGATSASAVSEGGGKSKITLVWPDPPLSAPAIAAKAGGASAKATSVIGAEAATMDAIAKRLGCDASVVKAVCDVESSGTFFWTIDGQQKPPVRLEAHHFGKYTNYIYNGTHPQISSTKWNPALAAKTGAGAYAQFEEARALNAEAAIKACSWGAFQIMGMHWQLLGYSSGAAMVESMQTKAGQTDAFIKFIEADKNLVNALRNRAWLTFAKNYNGAANAEAYASKLEAAWLNYQV